MSEPIGLTIKIGGELPASLIKEFLGALQDECYDIVGPTTEKGLHTEIRMRKRFLKWHATSNYGECDSLKSFCREHNLGYIHHCDGTGEYNASVQYWVPGMKCEQCSEANQEGDQTIQVSQIKPLTDLLLEYAKRGQDAFPLFVGTSGLEEIIEKGLKKPSQALKIIEEKIQSLLPGEPTLPPFIIKE